MQLILNDVAGSEILLILVFILIFFGAKSIPGLARTLGRTIRQVKDASAEIQNEIRKSSNDMKNDLNLKGMIEETAEDIKRPLDQYAHDLDNAVKYQPPNRNTKVAAPTVNVPDSDPEVEDVESQDTTEDEKE
jgi:sec-independent protein translocase protein TatA